MENHRATSWETCQGTFNHPWCGYKLNAFAGMQAICAWAFRRYRIEQCIPLTYTFVWFTTEEPVYKTTLINFALKEYEDPTATDPWTPVRISMAQLISPPHLPKLPRLHCVQSRSILSVGRRSVTWEAETSEAAESGPPQLPKGKLWPSHSGAEAHFGLWILVLVSFDFGFVTS